MTTAKLIETHNNRAKIYQGDICKAKTIEFLEEITVPKGLLPVDEVEEFNRGFMWLKVKKKTDKKFKKIGQNVIYNMEITCFFEKGHMFKVIGVKAKELLVPVVINDFRVGDPGHDMIKFTTSVGLGRSFPISAFEIGNKNNWLLGCLELISHT